MKGIMYVTIRPQNFVASCTIVNTQFFCQLQVNEERTLPKLCLLHILTKKSHARKGKSLVAFNATKYFSILQKIQNFLPNLISTQNRKQKHNFWHRIQKLKRLVGKTMPS